MLTVVGVCENTCKLSWGLDQDRIVYLQTRNAIQPASGLPISLSARTPGSPMPAALRVGDYRPLGSVSSCTKMRTERSQGVVCGLKD